MASHPITKITEEEYLALDRAAEVRSEYFNGEMFAMSGGSMRHAQLQGNIFGELYNALRGGACRAYGSDFRVRVSPGRMYTYPDVTVVCGKPLLADERQDVLLNPVVIFEVLSPSTEQYDRGLKLQYYRRIESLSDYILVDQNQIHIEQYTRGDAGVWTLRDYQNLEEELRIPSIGVALALGRIYDRVELPAS
ncbi:MAG TPA: Uma2 family endonuclease [Candidatus Binataceae bacterium]|nr:Uma2 family endonuclease [Candidatus Binataceae bacterium]